MPSLASMSSEPGSMPFWLMTTKLPPSVQTCRGWVGVQRGNSAWDALLVKKQQAAALRADLQDGGTARQLGVGSRRAQCRWVNQPAAARSPSPTPHAPASPLDVL